MVGSLIRQLRLERDYSQAGLAHGICAASYLSKIEQGQVEAGAEILDRLFQALGVTYCRDSRLLEEAAEQLAAYYEAWERDAPVDASAAWLDARQEQLRYSDLCLSLSIWQVYRALDRKEREAGLQLFRQLKAQEHQMTAEQEYRWLMVGERLTRDEAEAQQILERAIRIKPCAVSWLSMGYLLSYLGQDSRCIEVTERAYSAAAEEGDLYVLIWASFLLGSCYTGQNMDFAEKYYRRAIRLGSRTEPRLQAWAAYNLGASYLEWNCPEKALYWLERSESVEEDQDYHNFLLYQKKALLFYQLERNQEALACLAQAESYLEEQRCAMEPWDRALYGDMLRFARFHLEGVRDGSYEALLLQIYEQAGAELGFGFRRFYGRYLIDLYRSQRRYKDALAILEAISAKFLQ